SPGLTFASSSQVGSDPCDHRSRRRFTELVERPWSTHSGTPVQNVSSSNLNIPTVTCACEFGTTDVESILKFSIRVGRDTGVLPACGSGRPESAGYLKSPVAPLRGPRSNCLSQAL